MTTPKELEAALGLEATSLKSDLTAHTERLASLAGRLDDFTRELTVELELNNATVTESAANITALAADVGALPTPPPPIPATKTVYGYSAAKTSLATSLSYGLKRPSVTRVYDADGTLSFPASRFTEAPLVWISWKAGQLLAASWGAQIDAYCRSTIPKTTKVWVGAHHEPENNAGAGQTLAQWAAAWRLGTSSITDACAKLRAEGWDIWSVPVICDWVFRGWSNQDIDLWYPKDGSLRADVLGFDSYSQGPNRDNRLAIGRLRTSAKNVVEPYPAPGIADNYQLFRDSAARAKLLGKPWAIGEYGLVRGDLATSDVLHGYTLAQRAQRFKDAAADLASLSNPPLAVCWYLDDGCLVSDTAGVTALNSTL